MLNDQIDDRVDKGLSTLELQQTSVINDLIGGDSRPYESRKDRALCN